MKNFFKRKGILCMYLYFAIIPLFCVLLDMFMSTISPDPEYGDRVNNFDFSMINQVIYFSVWCAIITSIWGFCMTTEFFNGKMPNWIKSRNAFTMVAAFNFLVFVIYVVGISISVDNVVGFNTWYKILKSVLEHFISPPLLFAFYFLQKNEKQDLKKYTIEIGWKTMIIPFVYVAFVFIRCVMIHTFIENIDTAFTSFPYDQIDPYEKPWYIVLLGTVAVIGCPYLLSIGFTYLGNINKWQPIPSMAMSKTY